MAEKQTFIGAFWKVMSEAEFLVSPYENIPEVSNFCHPLFLIDI